MHVQWIHLFGIWILDEQMNWKINVNAICYENTANGIWLFNVMRSLTVHHFLFWIFRIILTASIELFFVFLQSAQRFFWKHIFLYFLEFSHTFLEFSNIFLDFPILSLILNLFLNVREFGKSEENMRKLFFSKIVPASASHGQCSQFRFIFVRKVPKTKNFLFFNLNYVTSNMIFPGEK